MATDGTIDAFISDDGGSTSDQVSPSADVADNQWHHFAFVRDSEVVTVYYDGVNVGTDAVDAVTTGMLTDDITIGANVDPGSNGGYADGLQLDDWQLSPTNAIGAEAIAKIHAEGRKQLNRGGSPINRDHSGARRRCRLRGCARQRHLARWQRRQSDGIRWSPCLADVRRIGNDQRLRS
jgi:hypothetical protein